MSKGPPSSSWKWNERGLLPAVVQDADSGEILMLAWMNQESLQLTLDTEVVHFYSRSRQSLWKKGETSGNTLHLVSLSVDCDLDAIVVRAHPKGPTCHTGARSCFFHQVFGNEQSEQGEQGIGEHETMSTKGQDVLEDLYRVMCERRDNASGETSYTKSLLDKGAPKICAKIMEESAELCVEIRAGEREKLIRESADLLFHLMVSWCANGIEPEAVWQELRRREGTSGHEEKASRDPKPQGSK